MEQIIEIVVILLIVAYVGIAIWCICKRQTVGGSLGASAGFLCGGAVIIPVAEAVAILVCWGAVIVVIVGILHVVFGGWKGA